MAEEILSILSDLQGRPQRRPQIPSVRQLLLLQDFVGRGRGVVHDTDALWLCVAEVATIPTFLRSACASSLCRGKGMGSVHQHGHSLVLPSVELAPLGAPRLAAAGAVQSQPSWGSAMHRVRVSPLPGSRAVQSGSRWVGRRPGAAHLGRRGCRFHSTSPSQGGRERSHEALVF